MKALIQDQTVTFDTHQAGDRQPIKVDDLHMHKRMNGRRHRGVNIRIPLNPNEEIDYRGNPNSESEIMNEIKSVFKKNPSKVTEMAKELASIIKRYGRDMTEENREGFLVGAAESIAKHFELKPEVKEKLMSGVRGLLTSHTDSQGKTYYIKQDINREQIKISDSLDHVVRFS